MAHGNIAYIAKQMGHANFTMLAEVYGKWMDDASEKEAEKIWNELQTKGHKAPKMPQEKNLQLVIA